ncbi:MAG: hypothetical protein RL088_1295 [Verrucomicrobiota bacterium]|jgi:two-component sensor histidine kinase/tetratricopeptide (TPR) repeat protein
MPDWLRFPFEIISQFTGGIDDGDHVVVDEIIAMLLWITLLVVSLLRQRRHLRNSEELLRWGFCVALGREIFSLVIEIVALRNAGETRVLRPLFPPFEHALGCFSQVVIAAGFMRSMFGNAVIVSGFLRTGVVITALCYAGTFWWWRTFAESNPDARFASVWCNSVFHIAAAFFTAWAAVLTARYAPGGIRRVVGLALMFLFFWDFLNIADMAMRGEFSAVLHPLSRVFRLAAISAFVFVYFLDALAKRAEAERAVADLNKTLELRVMERTLELEEAQEWRRRAELDEQQRTREALKLQHILFELAKLDKSDFAASIGECLRSAGDAIRVARVSYWATSAGGSELTCRFLRTMSSEAISNEEIKLSADRFPAYFKAIARMTQIVADDAQVCEDTREFTVKYLAPLGITSLLDVPVWHKGGMHGIVSFEHCGPARKWTQAELDFSQSIAEMVAQCIESSERLAVERKLALAQERKAALSELEAAINRAEDLQSVLNRIAETITRFVPATGASVVLWDAETESFSVSATTVPGQPAQAGAQLVRRRGGASRKIVDTRRPIITPDIRKDPAGASPLLEQSGMHAYAGVPMQAHGVVLGVLYAIDREVRDYTQDEIDFLSSAASHASAALWQFRMNASVRETNARLAAEIAERRRAEELIAASLHEKDALMQEIHNRVSNNLEMVSNLLSIQATEYQNPNLRMAFLDSQQRIRTMALADEMLHEAEVLAGLDLGALLRRLVPGLMRSFGSADLRVSFEIHADSVELPPGSVIPLALIVNELISNSIKHAFPDGQGGQITIRLATAEDGRVRLTVSDDGVGLPPDFDVSRSNSLGLRLIGMMAGRISAELKSEGGAGATFTLTFAAVTAPDPKPPR